ncbi:iron transporter biosynthesis regulating transcription factor, partial [Powellomyces hirtus]
CANCGTDSTPLWRRGPKGEIICNACGLYLKARNTYRPQYLKKRRVKRECDMADIMACINCSTTSTPLWRRDDKGNAICNACGLYFKLHNSHRPVTMKRAVIKRRKRVP